MSKYIVDIHGDIEGDYEIIGKYEEPKVGHWVEDGIKRNFLDTDIRRGVEMKRYLGKGYHTYINEACSVCRSVTIHDDSIAYAYCPHCGAKMIESQESEAAEI